MRESEEIFFSAMINCNFMWKLYTSTIKIRIELFKNNKIDD